MSFALVANDYTGESSTPMRRKLEQIMALMAEIP
jgi:hypothetical protein